MHTPNNAQSWEHSNILSDAQSLPSVDDRSARPSGMKRLIRRMGLSSSENQDISHLPESSSSRSSGSLAKSFASTSSRTVNSDRSAYRPAGLLTRLLEGRSSENELPDIADMLEDDNLAWGAPPPKSSKSRRRRQESPQRANHM
ncbi:hypothetical protein BC628DRAFT_254953 [Trametes gibbosa]|nr:hypothetical protein BC628DRAFT_254953 [Trametes gibbosa]